MFQQQLPHPGSMQTNRWSASRQQSTQAQQLAASGAQQEATGLNRKRASNWDAARKHPCCRFALLQVAAVKYSGGTVYPPALAFKRLSASAPQWPHVATAGDYFALFVSEVNLFVQLSHEWMEFHFIYVAFKSFYSTIALNIGIKPSRRIDTEGNYFIIVLADCFTEVWGEE